MAHPGDHAARPARRVTDAERDDAVARLRAAVAEGALDLDEMGERVESAYRARTAGELALVLDDLPVPAQPRGRAVRSGTLARLWRNDSFRSHATVYTLVNGFLVGIWVVTTGLDSFFWPFFPMGGWGIGLGSHAMATSAYEAAKERRAARPGARPEARPDHALPSQPGATALHAAPPRRADEPVQDRVAVLFTDVVASSQLAAALGDGGWSRLRARHRATVNECLRHHGGHEVNVVGDGILARLPDEAAAVRCAVDIHRALRRQQDETGFAPRVRTAVHAGTAVVEGSDLVGAAVNLVFRVAAEAEPDEVLVTETVAERVGARFETEDRGLRHLKGIEEPRHLLAVRWS